MRKLVTRLAAQHPSLSFCYEAGPCGYRLYRQILALGYPCLVVALSLIPTKPDGYIKTNRQDATMPASLFALESCKAHGCLMPTMRPCAS